MNIRHLLLLIFIPASLLLSVDAQKINQDSTRAMLLFHKGISAQSYEKYDSAMIYFNLARRLFAGEMYRINGNVTKSWAQDYYRQTRNEIANIYLKTDKPDSAKSILIWTEINDRGHAYPNDSLLAKTKFLLGLAYYNKGEFMMALSKFQSVLSIYKESIGEGHLPVAEAYDKIAEVYYNIGYYPVALEKFIQAMNIRISSSNSNTLSLANSYDHVGATYSILSQDDSALYYLLKALSIRQKLPQATMSDLGGSYNNLGIAYHSRGDYGLALEYYSKSLELIKNQKKQDEVEIANCYMNIGGVLHDQDEQDNAIQYFQDAYKVYLKIFGPTNVKTVNALRGIASAYKWQSKYDTALAYNLKVLTAYKKELFFENNLFADIYGEIGDIYDEKNNFDSALNYYNKALILYKKFSGTRSKAVAQAENAIGNLFLNKGMIDSASFHKNQAIEANIRPHTKGANSGVFSNEEYINSLSLAANCCQARIDAYSGDEKTRDKNTFSDLEEQNSDWSECIDILENQRKSIIRQNDKLKLLENTNEIYTGAVYSSYELYRIQGNVDDLNNAFYFSEKNKAGILLEAIADAEGMKFSGISDSLLVKERNLKSLIKFYEKAQISEIDSIHPNRNNDSLFKYNRLYDQLIARFEKEFPEYYNLKYGTKPASVEDIQNILDDKTEMRSYFTSDSFIVIFTLTKKELTIWPMPKIAGLDDSIQAFRKYLSQPDMLNKNAYQQLGYLLYQQLFPKDAAIPRNIKNIVIIPDGNLALIPFEALLTKAVKGEKTDFAEFPYLVKLYAISYSYSAQLFFKTMKKSRDGRIESSKLYDWLALAPVFSDEDEKGITLTTRKFFDNVKEHVSAGLLKRGMLMDGNYIPALPGTEDEIKSIFREFDKRKLKAQILLHKDASEEFVKSGELSKYKYLHFSTHGFVNSENPELSGIILAQNKGSNEDGILYEGEIYGLNLNAHLVVLSACETGLGQIRKGEGLIGLTRALLYAGARNIVVSLWQVSDQSTTDLMISFYKKLLDNKLNEQFSESLQQAKLEMIHSGRYAHPFYWSSFILIGK
jgi:CHAT domain-containing protein